MSKEYIALPMASSPTDEEKANIGPIVERSSSEGSPRSSDAITRSHEGLLPGGSVEQDKNKIHPAIIIAIWIALSSSVIVYNK